MISKAILTPILLFALAFQTWAEEKTEPTTAPEPTAEERRQTIDSMRSEVLVRLFENIPDAREILEQSMGYAVFSKKGMNLLMFSTARGAGVLRDHRDGSDLYMKVFGAGTGVGAGLTSYTAVLVFETEAALDDFREKGWELKGQADAHVDDDKPSDEPGKELSGTAGPGVLVYQMTDAGFAVQALVQAFKYWADPELNE